MVKTIAERFVLSSSSFVMIIGTVLGVMGLPFLMHLTELIQNEIEKLVDKINEIS